MLTLVYIHLCMSVAICYQELSDLVYIPPDTTNIPTVAISVFFVIVREVLRTCVFCVHACVMWDACVFAGCA